MDLHTSALCLLAAILATFWQKNVQAVSCYICSWSPPDEEVEADRCTEGHFDEHRVRIETCKDACEVVKITDSNGDLLMFYRNCFMAYPGKLMLESSSKRTAMTDEEVNVCESDLCNDAVANKALGHVFLLLPSLLTFWYPAL